MFPMLKIWKVLWVWWLLSCTLSVYADQVRVDSLRYWTAPDYTRLVFDVSLPAPHQVFLLKNPARLVVDFTNAKLLRSLAQPPLNHAVFSRVRSAARNKKDLRVVVDLKTSVSPKSFLLKPDKSYGNRLVVDLFTKKYKANKSVSKKYSNKKVAVKTIISKAKKIIIAIDAGHGGEDPGASGARGTHEKKVVLQIAKKVAALINKQRGMKAVLVRKGDYYINLRKRMEIARAAKADLFVSIHADAFKSSKVQGASVFTLSNSGASSEAARWLAENENAADLVGGLKLADKDDMLASVLMDLSQTATKEASRKVAGKILNNLKSIGHIHKPDVQKAGFMVLKSPDIPSILIETAFISNPGEERKLNSAAHQRKLARAISRGIVSYFKQYAPANTSFASVAREKHVITRGETLSGIALQYGVSMKSIKLVNALANSRIRIGQVLKIPKGT